MALLKHNTFFKLIPRYYSQRKTIQKSVFISQSKDVYSNLALQDWLYQNFDFTNHHLLMVYQNDPCVIIGHNQNPWLETNIGQLNNITKTGAKLARRPNNGDVLYNDQGNLNLTFFTSNNNYNSKYNLELIRRVLFREYFTKLDISSSNEDLNLRGNKVTGSSTKFGEYNAYHHCSLFVNINKINYSQALQKMKVDATKSVYNKEKIKNLTEENPKITISSLIKEIGWEFLRTHATDLIDGGMELANQQRGFQMINPTNSWFPGLNDIKENLKSWQWLYGATPKFIINRSFSTQDNNQSFNVTIEVDAGRITNVKMFLPLGLAGNGFSGNVDVVTSLIGHKFSEDIITKLDWSFSNILNDKDRFLSNCIKHVMSSV